jgi:hypothetical protein
MVGTITDRHTVIDQMDLVICVVNKPAYSHFMIEVLVGTASEIQP